MPYISIVEYTGDGATTDFTFDVPYIHEADVHGYEAGIEKTISFVDPTTVRFAVAPGSGQPVAIRRETNMDTAETTFPASSAYFKSEQLNTNQTQALYLLQEQVDALTFVIPDAAEYVGYAAEWANKAEDSLVSLAAGGDAVDDYSSLHWAAKAATSGAQAIASAAAADADAIDAAASAASALASATSAAADAAGLATLIQNVVYVTNADSPKAVTASGNLYICDTSGGDITLTLPALAGATPYAVAVKKDSSDANKVTLGAAGTDEIDNIGATSYQVTQYEEGVTLLGDEGLVPDTWQSSSWGKNVAVTGSAELGDEFAMTLMGRDLSKPTTHLASLSVSAVVGNPRALCFNSDGTKMYIANLTTIYQYSCATPYMVLGATYDSVSHTLSTITGLNGMTMKEDGSKIFLSDGAGSKGLYVRNLTTPGDITTITTTSQSYFYATTSEQNGAWMHPDGTHVYWTNGLDPDTVEQLILTEEWNMFSAEYHGNLNVFAENPSAEGVLTSPDGTKFWVNDDSVGLYQYSCATPFDVRTGTYDSYVFDFTGEDSSCWGFAMSPDGKYLYVSGYTTDSVIQYELTQDEIPQVASRTVRGAAAFATAEETSEQFLGYKAVSPATMKYAFMSLTSDNDYSVKVSNRAWPHSSHSSSTAVGWDTLAYRSTSGSSAASVFGYGAAAGHISQNKNGVSNLTALGYYAGYGVNGTSYSVCVGENAGTGTNSGSIGTHNVSIGYECMRTTYGNYHTTAVGANALDNIYNGSYNTALGKYAGFYATAGSSHNTFIGANAGKWLQSGSDNVYLGYNSGPTSYTTQSNQLYIDITARSDALIRGDFSARTVTINGSFNATGGISGGYVNDGTGTALDFTAGLSHAIAPGAATNPTYTFTAPAAGAEVTLVGTNLGAAGTITWPTTVKWAGGAAPTWTSSGRDTVQLLWDGTDYLEISRSLAVA